MIVLVDSEGPDQAVWMYRLIWAFAVHICLKTHFACIAMKSSFIAPDKREYTDIFFLFLHENISCWYSLEAPQWGTVGEH